MVDHVLLFTVFIYFLKNVDFVYPVNCLLIDETVPKHRTYVFKCNLLHETGAIGGLRNGS